MIPGLWDQHTHLAQWTLSSQRLDLAAARSPEDATRLVAERIADYPDLPVIGWGHRSAGWDREVTVSELDAVSGDTAVVLISGDGHHAWLNTTALLHLAMPVRDSVVRETEWFAAYPRLVTLVGNDGTSPEAYRRMLDEAAGRGHRRPGRLRVRRRVRRVGRALGAGLRPAADPHRDVLAPCSTT